jgi:hypothetical protein
LKLLNLILTTVAVEYPLARMWGRALGRERASSAVIHIPVCIAHETPLKAGALDGAAMRLMQCG